MKYDEFVGQVQHRARLAATDQALRAIRATLMTLGDRLAGGESDDLAAQLPQEIGDMLRLSGGTGERFGIDEFFRRVAEAEEVDLPEATFHARAVVSVVVEAVSLGELSDVIDQLPADYMVLFGGGEGQMRAA